MMRKISYFILSGLLVLLQACSSNSDEDVPVAGENTVEVEIETNILTRADVTTLFVNGDEMNIWAKTYNKVDAPNMMDDIKGTYSGNRWEMTPKITLNEGERTFIYAYAPYSSQITDLAKIPIDISTQQDVLYSGNAVPVSYTSHKAKLVMKHALALVTLNISSQGYEGAGHLQSISLHGDKVYTTGVLHIETGKVVGTGKETVTVPLNHTVMMQGWNKGLPRMWAIPFSTKVETAFLKARIDDEDYQVRFPEVEMKSGYQYIFHLVLTRNGLEFIPDQTQNISLNQESDQMEALEGYGMLRFVHNVGNLELPILAGDNVFGIVTWGDGMTDSYRAGGNHTYSTLGEKEIFIESWNSTGFELEKLTGIEVIDISQY
ncbi:fimbrillin family protein [Bacteroides muris (ex Fokt et al. 2023)]|uniref:Fimbrillin family protein n=1 Tax=Bacteroides muris (ex Fokt et al. 2023) TaxID=2937417 RepID=A0A9X2STA5_9BACE|nr:fimbrillin family protein [Bacteroides muris (ex Fokt et al. 2023)]MCR6504945.1 fimbrillin family protein [Bacteroides muris (ex Fokt et al. 2023)]